MIKLVTFPLLYFTISFNHNANTLSTGEQIKRRIETVLSRCGPPSIMVLVFIFVVWDFVSLEVFFPVSSYCTLS